MEDALIGVLPGIDSPTLANAIELLDVRNRATGFCNRTMRQLTPEMGTLCGYAVTVQATTAAAESYPRDKSVERYIDVCRAIEAAPKPAVVVFHEFGPQPECSVHDSLTLSPSVQPGRNLWRR